MNGLQAVSGVSGDLSGFDSPSRSTPVQTEVIEMSNTSKSGGFETAREMENREDGQPEFVLVRADGSTASRSQCHTQISVHDEGDSLYYVSLGSEQWVTGYFDHIAEHTQRGFLVHKKFVQILVNYVTACGYNVTVARSAWA